MPWASWLSRPRLLLIALGLAVCFRSNVWNIGAEGQFVIGAVAAGGIALLADKTTGPWIVPAILIAGMLGGMVWAGIVALLRDRFNANEILVSLMLVYVATLVLGYLVYGPWKDPMGYNFPQTKSFERVTQIPRLVQGMRMNIGVIISLVGPVCCGHFCFARVQVLPCRSAAWRRRRHAMPAFPRARRCGRRC
jgi:simple sugar transport system permease protein